MAASPLKTVSRWGICPGQRLETPFKRSSKNDSASLLIARDIDGLTRHCDAELVPRAVASVIDSAEVNFSMSRAIRRIGCFLQRFEKCDQSLSVRRRKV